MLLKDGFSIALGALGKGRKPTINLKNGKNSNFFIKKTKAKNILEKRIDLPLLSFTGGVAQGPEGHSRPGIGQERLKLGVGRERLKPGQQSVRLAECT